MAGSTPIQAVQVHLIMGFLGVGKTTAIKHLLARKPQDERWAVLVNEFGEIGVDGALIRDGSSADIAVQQIPGGCMCCAAGPVTQVSLNNLLRRERPDRLLIEPSGLGHPADILRLLRAPEYQGVLQVRDVVAVLDPRHVIQPRYQKHALFKDQLRVADCIVLNKTDVCEPAEVHAAHAWLDDQVAEAVPRHEVAHGEISLAWLHLLPEAHSANEEAAQLTESEIPLPVLDWRTAPQAPQPGQWVEVSHAADGFYSVGWRVAGSEIWSADRLLTEMMIVDALRIKGVVATDRGWLVINVAEGSLSASDLPAQEEGVIEIIHDAPLDTQALQARLRACQVDPA